MGKDTGFHEYVLEQLEGVEGVVSRRMFGGYGIYKDGLIFGIIADGRLYFKTDELNRADFEEHGSTQFTYTHKKGKTASMHYYEVPHAILDDRHDLRNWVQKSLFVSMRSRKKQVS